MFGSRKRLGFAVGAVLAGLLACQDCRSSGVCPAPHVGTVPEGLRYGLPPQLEKQGLTFAGERIPLDRKDVHGRIVKEINYLLLDRRSRALVWLSRADSFAPVILPVLRKYELPPETMFLAAIESSFNPRALSSAGAYGYWQFIRATAARGPAGCDEYDWKMEMLTWRDDRADLVKSTHSAARYLAWMDRRMQVKVNGRPDREGFRNLLFSAAAYNAGPKRVTERLSLFGGDSYWDVALPAETERYVPRWIAISIISTHRAFYGMQIPRRHPVSFETLTKVRLKKDLSFAAMAGFLNITPRAVWELNSCISAEKAVFPARSGLRALSHTINVPAGARKKFLTQLKGHGYTRD